VQGGREALRLLLEGADFDIVFCDLLMPDISGVDLYYALELNRPGFEQRIVFMTGGVFTPEAERFVLTVSNPRIEKPFNLKAVERLLNNAAGRRTREAQGPASESGLPEGSAVGSSSGPSSG
jgi:DNA-binding NtrC family response regulator